MSYKINPQFLSYGGAKKASHLMSNVELKQAAEAIIRKVKKDAFSKGLPIYYAEDNKIIAEYGDGRKVIVKNLEYATRSARRRRSQRHR